MVPSRAIGNFQFPTYKVVIISLSHSSDSLSERIQFNIPLVDNHKHSWLDSENYEISVKCMLISLFIIHTICLKRLFIYSGYGKYSDPLTFFTLCYIATIC